MKSSIKAIHEELKRRGITATPLSLGEGGTLLTFEYADALRAVVGTSPDLTNSTGRTIANNKEAAAAVALHCGLPVPDTITYGKEKDALAFLKTHGRIVVKPLDGAHGYGVTTNITTSVKMKKAIKRALKESQTVLIQQQVSGNDIRVLIIGGKLAAIAERVPASVVGDGKHSLGWLITRENKNPARGRNYEKAINIIDVEAAKTYLGKRISERPAKGENVVVIGTANIGLGGTAIECTNSMPKEMVRQAEKFSQAAGVFTCGVDFMFDQAANEWFFIEANSSPSFGLHLFPTVGNPIDVTGIFVDRLLAAYDVLPRTFMTDSIIGGNVSIDIIGHADAVPAKIDTGADSSSIWASNIRVDEANNLHFTLFDKKSPNYTGEEITRKKFSATMVRSSNGHQQIRYKTTLTTRISGRRVRVNFTLADRSRNNFPVLIGRRTLHGKFWVDVRHDEHERIPASENEEIVEKIKQNPYEFHTNYYQKHHSQKKGA